MCENPNRTYTEALDLQGLERRVRNAKMPSLKPSTDKGFKGVRMLKTFSVSLYII